MNKVSISQNVPRGYDTARFADFFRQIEAFRDSFLMGEATYDPANLVDGAGATTTVSVPGAVMGDFAVASFSNDLQGITLTAYVSSVNTVSVRFQNESGGALDLASGTLRALVIRR